MVTSFFLAKVLGLYLLVMGLGIIINRKVMADIVRGYLSDKALYHLTSILTLIIGILLVTVHSVWASAWQGVISIISWLIFLKGLSRALIPQSKYVSWIEKWTMSESKYLFIGIVSVAIGVYLSYIGFIF